MKQVRSRIQRTRRLTLEPLEQRRVLTGLGVPLCPCQLQSTEESSAAQSVFGATSNASLTEDGLSFVQNADAAQSQAITTVEHYFSADLAFTGRRTGPIDGGPFSQKRVKIPRFESVLGELVGVSVRVEVSAAAVPTIRRVSSSVDPNTFAPISRGYTLRTFVRSEDARTLGGISRSQTPRLRDVPLTEVRESPLAGTFAADVPVRPDDWALFEAGTAELRIQAQIRLTTRSDALEIGIVDGLASYNASVTYNYVPTRSPDIVIHAARTTDGTSVLFQYSVNENPGPFSAHLYQSTDEQFDESDRLLTSATIFTMPNSAGSASLSIPITTRPDPTRPHLLLVADALDQIEETNEANNQAVVALADLVGTSFHYKVPSDSIGAENGPLPTNASYEVFGTIRNQGRGDSGPVTVAVYLSFDNVIDPTVDFEIGTTVLSSLASGDELSFKLEMLPVSTWPNTLPPWSGKVTIGMMIDPDRNLFERTFQNNRNSGIGVDTQSVHLYDPIPPVKTVLTNATYRQALLWLFRNGFKPVPPLTGSGWSKSLSSNIRIRSPFDGQTRSGLAYRQNAFIVGSGGKYSVVVQGSETIAEPNPETALLYGVRWFDYVADWHPRF